MCVVGVWQSVWKPSCLRSCKYVVILSISFVYSDLSPAETYEGLYSFNDGRGRKACPDAVYYIEIQRGVLVDATLAPVDIPSPFKLPQIVWISTCWRCGRWLARHSWFLMVVRTFITISCSSWVIFLKIFHAPEVLNSQHKCFISFLWWISDCMSGGCPIRSGSGAPAGQAVRHGASMLPSRKQPVSSSSCREHHPKVHTVHWLI